MKPRPDHAATIVAMRQLAGKQQPIHLQIDGVIDAARVLAALTQSWRPFAPRPSSLDGAIAQCDALARSLRELRLALSQGGPNDAA